MKAQIVYAKVPPERRERYLKAWTEWTGTLSVTVFDEIIPKDLLVQTVEYAGIFIGVGQFRPENQGSFGRFKATNWKWTEL